MDQSLSETKMQVIDTHAHLNFNMYDNDRKEVIKTAFANDVKKISTSASMRKHLKNQLNLL